MHDQYSQTEAEAIVISVTQTGRYFFIELSDNIFYPGGGGQPCDTGDMGNERYGGKFQGRVIEIIKEQGGLAGCGQLSHGHHEQRILHKVESNSTMHDVQQGSKVFVKVDAARRESLKKMHTAEHILFKAIEKAVSGSEDINSESTGREISLQKIDLDVDESSVFVLCRDLNWKDIFAAEKLANSIIAENQPVLTKEFSKEEAARMPRLRIKEDRIKSNKIRVVEVKGFDESACTGLHVSETGEIGAIIVTGLNQSGSNSSDSKKYEVKFTTRLDELFRMADSARESASILATSVNDVPKLIHSMKQEVDGLKMRAKELSAKAASQVKEEKVGSAVFCTVIADFADKKQLIEKAGEIAAEHKIAVFVNKTERSEVYISVPEHYGILASEIAKILAEFGGKGGGRETFASGSMPLEKTDEFLKKVRSMLKEKFV